MQFSDFEAEHTLSVDHHDGCGHGEHFGFGGVGTAGEDDGSLSSDEDASDATMGEIDQGLGQHVAGLDVGDHEDVSLAGDGPADTFVFGGHFGDGVVEGEGAVDGNEGAELVALAHLGQDGGVEGNGHVGVDQLDCGEDGYLGFHYAEEAGEVDGVENDLGFLLEVRGDVHGAVGDEDEAFELGYFDNEDVTHKDAGAEAVFLLQDGAEEIVGVDVSFHDDVGPAGGGEFDGFSCGLSGIGFVDDGGLVQLEIDLGGLFEDA